MFLTKNLDEGLKEGNSLFFRILIILYASSITFIYNSNFDYTTYFAFIVYALVFILLRKKFKSFRRTRLLNDFLFITFILYKLGTPNLHLGLFVLLPLINTLNHTHSRIRKSFSIQLYILTIACFLIVNHFHFDYSYLIPIATITILNLFMAVRIYFYRINNTLDNVIENFYNKREGIFKSYKIVKEVIKTVNEEPFLGKFINIKRVSFYKVWPSNKSYVTMSSDFIYNYEIDDILNERFELYLDNVTGQINDTPIVNGLALRVKGNERAVVNLILVEFGKKVSYITSLLLIEKIFLPVFNRIININDFELEMHSLKAEYFNKAKQEFENIDSAANAVHFLANKLTPVTNYFKMLEALDSGKIPDEKKIEWEGLIKDDFTRATKNIKSIQTKMMQIAEYTNNPNIISEFENLKIKSFITFLRKAFLESSYNFTDIHVDIFDLLVEKSIQTNIQALDFVFIELIDNFNKHSDSIINVTISTPTESNLVVTFSNKIKDYNAKTKITDEYVNDFNTGQISELLQRRGNKGIKFLKQFLLQLQIEHSCEQNDGFMFIYLKFKLI